MLLNTSAIFQFVIVIISVKLKTSKVIREAISAFLIDENTIKENLSGEDLNKLNEVCLGLRYKRKFDYWIKKYIELLKAQAEDVCLDITQAMQEVDLIRGELKKDEKIGYIYTNNHRFNQDHFEVLIISEQIIKPLNWSNQAIPVDESGLHEIYYTKIAPPLVSRKTGWQYPFPQAGPYECATMGMLYLKELLKDDALQLKEFTLRFPYYDADKKLHYFFLPSPQVSRYSQSTCYNKLIEAMLQDAETVIVYHNKGELNSRFWEGPRQEEYSVTTIKKMLQDAISIATMQERMDVVDHNEQLLSNLASFSEKWLKEYQQTMKKHALMCDKDGVNQYLVYSTRRMEKIAKVGCEIKFTPRMV